MIASASSVANGSAVQVPAAKGKRRSRTPLAGTKPGPGEPAVAGEPTVLREQVCSRLGEERGRRAWTPNAQDQQVYHWVRFEGKRQTWVAFQLGIHQATVSRIVERYERWQAHAREREGGRLDPAERLRAQRWLTYERNEVILASALRIAGEMEGFMDISKSVISRPLSQPSAEREMRTETAVIDRHGIAARFLRLAFRINMEQLKLVEQDAPPMPENLSEDEIEETERLSAEIAEELRAARQRSDQQIAEIEQRRQQEEAAVQELARQEIEERESLAGTKPDPGESPRSMENEVAVLREQVCSRLGDEVMHEVHKMHITDDAKMDASAQPACSCAVDAAAEKNPREGCIGEPAAPTPGAMHKRESPQGALRTASPCEHVPVARRDRLRPVVQS